MIYVGINVAADKHDCCILDGSGIVLRENITIRNYRDECSLLPHGES